MKMKEVREIAKKISIKTGGIKKDDLIRAIQLQEGNTPCFKTEVNDCGETDCCWRSDCQGWIG